MDQTKFGSFIADCRKENKLTQEQLAEKLGVSSKSISRWENGKTMPDYSVLPDLCSNLNISINELFSCKKIPDETFKTEADKNLLCALENSNINLKEKITFLKKTWLKKNFYSIILGIILWCVLIIMLKYYDVGVGVSGFICGMFTALIYSLLKNNMNHYVEKHLQSFSQTH